MMKLKVFENLSQAVALYQSLGDKVAPEMSMALNRAAHGVRTDVSRVIPKTRSIDKEEVKDWKIGRSTPETLEVFAKISGPRLGLEDFNPNPGAVMGGKTSGGVTASIFGKSVTFRHAFIGSIYAPGARVYGRKRGKKAKDPKGRYVERIRRNGVMVDKERPLKGKFPTYKLTAVSVPQMADDEDVVNIVVAKAEERFLKQFDHVIDRLTQDFA